MKKAILQAIKTFDISTLNILLDDNSPYMDVPRSLFLETLERKFKEAEEDGCFSFDDVFFGICGSCNKGCERMTFITNFGHYLDLYIETKGDFVKDIYVCNKLINFTDLDKTHCLGFCFYKEEEVGFNPSLEYNFINEQYNFLLQDIKVLKNNIKLDELTAWFTEYSSLKSMLDEIGLFRALDFKLYSKASDLISDFDRILNIKARADHAAVAIISYQMAAGEREKLIWFFENRMDQHALNGFIWTEDSTFQETIIYKTDALQLLLIITGYEYVVDYFKKVAGFYAEMMHKYKPLSIHFEESEPDSLFPSLENYLRLHNMHLDIVARYDRK